MKPPHIATSRSSESVQQHGVKGDEFMKPLNQKLAVMLELDIVHKIDCSFVLTNWSTRMTQIPAFPTIYKGYWERSLQGLLRILKEGWYSRTHATVIVAQCLCMRLSRWTLIVHLLLFNRKTGLKGRPPPVRSARY